MDGGGESATAESAWRGFGMWGRGLSLSPWATGTAAADLAVSLTAEPRVIKAKSGGCLVGGCVALSTAVPQVFLSSAVLATNLKLQCFFSFLFSSGSCCLINCTTDPEHS